MDENEALRKENSQMRQLLGKHTNMMSKALDKQKKAEKDNERLYGMLTEYKDLLKEEREHQVKLSNKVKEL